MVGGAAVLEELLPPPSSLARTMAVTVAATPTITAILNFRVVHQFWCFCFFVVSTILVTFDIENVTSPIRFPYVAVAWT